MRTMKTKYLIGGLILGTVMVVRAATNDLTAALQKGLFEEEANHNFLAAIQAYQEAIAKFDKDRQLAATAVFRLGECYRKQGNTNEATVQYERVLREFADQAQLATLSRSYLAAPEKPKPTEAGNLAGTTAETEEVKRIQEMIKNSPDLINAADGGGSAPLHKAAQAGQMVVAQFLLANGADVVARNRSGQTALHLAAANGHKAMVELLLSHKANIQAGDNSPNTPLHLAVEKGFKSVAEVLLAHGADVNAKGGNDATPLHLAVANRFKSLAEFLLAHHANANAARSNDGNMPLHVAAEVNLPLMADLLLGNKAEVNAANRNGDTPLHLAAMKGNLEVATNLIAHGADVNAKNTGQNRLGWTPLHYAVEGNQKAMVALLLQSKADPNARIQTRYGEGGDGYTPLLMATARVLPEIVDLLLAANADPNLRTDTRAPILNVINNENLAARKQMLTALLGRGAEVDVRDVNDRTPLMWASLRIDKDSVSLLLAHKANVNAHDNTGNTPLHLVASRSGDADLTELGEMLIGAGADVNVQDRNGQTPLNLGERRSANQAAFKFAELLRQHGAMVDVPRLDRIQLRRPAAKYTTTVFSKGTNDYNHFTLLELLAVHYGFVSTELKPGPGARMFGPAPVPRPPPALPGMTGFNRSLSSRWTLEGSLTFPNLEKVVIRRPTDNGKGWRPVSVDLAAILGSGDCSKDFRLEWGDVVELPEADHPISAVWGGFSEAEQSTLTNCLKRQVEITVKGQTTTVPLRIQTSNPRTGPSFGDGRAEATVPQFSLLPVLSNSGLLRASSDVSRVKVQRHDPVSGQIYTLVLDCSNINSPPDLWLRNGDTIQVPEKAEQP
jgi:ankyrin repeat protein